MVDEFLSAMHVTLGLSSLPQAARREDVSNSGLHCLLWAAGPAFARGPVSGSLRYC